MKTRYTIFASFITLLLTVSCAELPTDNDIIIQKEKVLKETVGTPDHSKAKEAYDEMLDKKHRNDRVVDKVEEYGDGYIPGLGGLIALIYSIYVRKQKKDIEKALSSTVQAVEAVKKGGDLVDTLKTFHNKDKVRDTIRKVREKVKEPLDR